MSMLKNSLFFVSFFIVHYTLLTLSFSILADDKEEGKETTGGGGLIDKISLYKGDITVLELDAIVNAGKDCDL